MRVCFSSIVLGLSAVAFASDSPPAGRLTDPDEILRRAREAVRQVKAVQFRFTRQGILADEGKAPRIEGTATISGWAQGWVQKFRVNSKVMRPGESEPIEVNAGADGNVVYLIDSKEKKVYADMDPAVLGSRMRFVRQSMIAYFVNPQAFEDELKSETKELKGTSKVGGDDCYEVRVARPGGSGDTVWFLSVADLLPRRLDLSFPTGEGQKGGFSIVLSELKVNPSLGSDAFSLAVPEGFTRTDDFAP